MKDNRNFTNVINMRGRAHALILTLLMMLTMAFAMPLAGNAGSVYADDGTTARVATFAQLKAALDKGSITNIIIDPQAAEDLTDHLNDDGEKEAVTFSGSDVFYIPVEYPLVVSRDITISSEVAVNIARAAKGGNGEYDSNAFKGQNQVTPALFNVDAGKTLTLEGDIMMTGEAVSVTFDEGQEYIEAEEGDDQEYIAPSFDFEVTSKDGSDEDNDVWEYGADPGKVAKGGYFLYTKGGNIVLNEDVVLTELHTSDDVQDVAPVYIDGTSKAASVTIDGAVIKDNDLGRDPVTDGSVSSAGAVIVAGAKAEAVLTSGEISSNRADAAGVYAKDGASVETDDEFIVDAIADNKGDEDNKKVAKEASKKDASAKYSKYNASIIGYDVTVNVPEGAFKENVELVVKEAVANKREAVNEKGDYIVMTAEQKAAVEKIEDAVKKTVIDVTFVNAAGEEVEPAKPVELQIVADKKELGFEEADNVEFAIVHIKNEEKKSQDENYVLETVAQTDASDKELKDTMEVDAEKIKADFTVDSFSQFVLYAGIYQGEPDSSSITFKKTSSCLAAHADPSAWHSLGLSDINISFEEGDDTDPRSFATTGKAVVEIDLAAKTYVVYDKNAGTYTTKSLNTNGKEYVFYGIKYSPNGSNYYYNSLISKFKWVPKSGKTMGSSDLDDYELQRADGNGGWTTIGGWTIWAVYGDVADQATSSGSGSGSSITIQTGTQQYAGSSASGATTGDGNVWISKVSSSNKTELLGGATFEIKKSTGEFVQNVTTVAGKKTALTLAPGSYVIREIQAPSGYALNSTAMSFNVYAQQVAVPVSTTSVTATTANDATNTIQISGDFGSAYASCIIPTVSNPAGQGYQILTVSDDSAIASAIGSNPIRGYTDAIKRLVAVYNGLCNANDAATFDAFFSGTNKEAAKRYIITKAIEYCANGKGWSSAYPNDGYGGIVNEMNNNPAFASKAGGLENLKAAFDWLKLNVINADYVGAVIDWNLIVLKPVSANVQSLVVLQPGATEIVMENTKENETPNVEGNLTIAKTDDVTGKLLGGAVFEIKSKTSNQVVATVRTSAGQKTVVNLPVGEYTITEIAAPDGYVLDSTSREFEITANQITVPAASDSYDYKGITINVDNYIFRGTSGFAVTDASGNLIGEASCMNPSKGDPIGGSYKLITESQIRSEVGDQASGDYNNGNMNAAAIEKIKKLIWVYSNRNFAEFESHFSGYPFGESGRYTAIRMAIEYIAGGYTDVDTFMAADSKKRFVSDNASSGRVQSALRWLIGNINVNIDYGSWQLICFKPSDPGMQPLVVLKPGSADVSIKNKAKKEIELIKTDSSGNAITGKTATFALYEANVTVEQISNNGESFIPNISVGIKDGGISKTGLTTDSSTGKLSIADIESNKIYLLFETSAPEGYKKSIAPWLLYVKKDGTYMLFKHKSNKKETSWSTGENADNFSIIDNSKLSNDTLQIKFTKGDKADSSINITGAKFALYAATQTRNDDNTKYIYRIDTEQGTNGLISNDIEYKNDVGGYLLPINPPTQGTAYYMLFETEAQSGYILPKAPWGVAIDEYGDYQINRFTDDAATNFETTYKDKDVLSEAELEALKIECTDIGVNVGDFKLLNEKEQIKLIKVSGTVSDIAVSIDKTKKLDGAKFQLYNATNDGNGYWVRGTVVGEELTTDENGEITLPREVTATAEEKDYWLEEISGVPGYVKATRPWILNVNNGSISHNYWPKTDVVVEGTTYKIRNGNENVIDCNGDNQKYVFNEPITISKVSNDGDASTGKEASRLGGAEFKAYKINNGTYYGYSVYYSEDSGVLPSMESPETMTAVDGDVDISKIVYSLFSEDENATEVEFFLYETTPAPGHRGTKAPWRVKVTKAGTVTIMEYRNGSGKYSDPLNMGGTKKGWYTSSDCWVTRSELINDRNPLDIGKVDSKTHEGLDGAEFEIWDRYGTNYNYATGEYQSYYAYNAYYYQQGYTKYKKGESGVPARAKLTSTDGKITIPSNLVPSRGNEAHYLMFETKAPEGYIREVTPWYLIIKTDSNGISSIRRIVAVDDAAKSKYNDSSSTWEVSDFCYNDLPSQDIPNTKLYDLPHTGGMGTYWFMVIGAMMMGFGATTLMIRKKAHK